VVAENGFRPTFLGILDAKNHMSDVSVSPPRNGEASKNFG